MNGLSHRGGCEPASAGSAPRAYSYPRVGGGGEWRGQPPEPCPASVITFVVCDAGKIGGWKDLRGQSLSRKPSPSKVSKFRVPLWALVGAPGHCPLWYKPILNFITVPCFGGLLGTPTHEGGMVSVHMPLQDFRGCDALSLRGRCKCSSAFAAVPLGGPQFSASEVLPQHL